VIRSSAAVEDIFKDVREALTKAIAKGGTPRDRAEQGIGPVIDMLNATEAELDEAVELLTPLHAAAVAENVIDDLRRGEVPFALPGPTLRRRRSPFAPPPRHAVEVSGGLR
jgi:hypothetical protein